MCTCVCIWEKESLGLGGQIKKKNRMTKKGKVGGPRFLVPVADLIELKTGNIGIVLRLVLIMWNVKHPRDIPVEAEVI